jgi:hypothetical protein
MRKAPITYLSIGFLIGVGTGSLAVSLHLNSRCSQAVQELILEASRADIVEAANTLTLLETDRHSTLVSNKQEQLSWGIWGLASVVPPTDASDEKSRRAYRIAANYWQEFPYETGDSNVDRRVQAILGQISERGGL